MGNFGLGILEAEAALAVRMILFSYFLLLLSFFLGGWGGGGGGVGARV